jgi:hypothetical protein
MRGEGLPDKDIVPCHTTNVTRVVRQGRSGGHHAADRREASR